MADKNNNGIDDSLEMVGKNNYRPGQKVVNASGIGGNKRAGVNPFFDNIETKGFGWGGFVNPVRQVLNFVGDWGNIGAGMSDRRVLDPHNAIGNGLGDRLMGVQRNFYSDANRGVLPKDSAPKAPGLDFTQGPQQNGPHQMTFLEALQQALGIVPGASMISRVNYDPQRQTARDNSVEADARLGAMYKQLQDSIAADSPVIQAAYQQAIDNTNATSNAAQQNVQAATDAASARNQSVLANLGIGDANQQIIAQGRDANTATANTRSDMAAAQQAATTNLAQNQTSSVQQNRSIGSAAGLEGNLKRAQNQAKLQALLAQIDMQEQDKNASIDAQNAQAGQGTLSQAMSLASQLYGSNRNDINDANNLQMQAMKLQQQGQMPDLGSMLKSLGISPQELAADPKKYAPLLQFGGKWQMTQ